MTGRGAVGSPLINPMRSGREKNPANTNNKKDILFKVSKSVKEVTPMIRKIIPNTISPTTKAKFQTWLLHQRMDRLQKRLR